MQSGTFYTPFAPYTPFQEERKGITGIDEARLRCVLKCLLGLSEEEAYVLAYLLMNPRPATAKDIATATGRNQEVVRRALRKLYTRGLINRRPFPLRRGGRAYIYEPRSDLIDKLQSLCDTARSIVAEATGETCEKRAG